MKKYFIHVCVDEMPLEVYAFRVSVHKSGDPESPKTHSQDPNCPSEPIRWVEIECLRPWGHPTRNEIWGTGQKAKASEYIAGILIRGEYAKLIGPGEAPEPPSRARKAEDL